MSHVQFGSSQSPADFLPRLADELWENRSGMVQSQDLHAAASRQGETLKGDSWINGAKLRHV